MFLLLIASGFHFHPVIILFDALLKSTSKIDYAKQIGSLRSTWRTHFFYTFQPNKYMYYFLQRIVCFVPKIPLAFAQYSLNIVWAQNFRIKLSMNSNNVISQNYDVVQTILEHHK